MGLHQPFSNGDRNGCAVEHHWGGIGRKALISQEHNPREEGQKEKLVRGTKSRVRQGDSI